MATRKIRKPRNTARVEDSGSRNNEAASPVKPRAPKKTSGNATVEKLMSPEGMLMDITYTASELVPVAQYANVSVGPVQITRRFFDPGDAPNAAELIEAAIKEMGDIVNAVIADDRELVEESVRSHNERAKENEKGGRRR